MLDNDNILLMAEKNSNAVFGILILIISIIGMIWGLFTFRQHIVLIFFIFLIITGIMLAKGNDWNTAGLTSIIIIGFIFIIILVFTLIAGMMGSGSNTNHQTDQPLSQSIPQPTPTKDLSYLTSLTLDPAALSGFTEAEDTKANSISQAIDYTNPITRDFAVGLVKKSSSGNYNINQICDIWEYGYNKWVYVNDPLGQDYYSPASRTISLGLKGDCDDFAVLNAAVIQSIGGSSRVVTACNVEGCHAYAEVYINEADLQSVTNDIGSRYGVKTVYYQRSVGSLGVPSYWLNLDWWATNPGGEFFRDNGMKHIFYSDGSHYVSTNSGETIISQTVMCSTIQCEPQRCPVSGCK